MVPKFLCISGTTQTKIFDKDGDICSLSIRGKIRIFVTGRTVRRFILFSNIAYVNVSFFLHNIPLHSIIHLSTTTVSRLILATMTSGNGIRQLIDVIIDHMRSA